MMQREDAQASASSAQVSGQGNRTLQEVLQDFSISEFSEAQLEAFINSLTTGTGISKHHFRKFLSYVLKFVEYNRSKYDRLNTELGHIKEELASMKDNLMTGRVSRQEPGLRPEASPAAIPPSAPQAMAAPLASQSTAPIRPLASQAMVPLPALQAMATGPVVSSTTYSLPVLNADGTISHKMDQVGNNVTVTFSGNDEMASKKSKLFGSSAKLDTFTGYDMSQFPEWVAQFLVWSKFVSTYRA